MAGYKFAKLEEWIWVRDQYRLSHTHVQMARDLGFNAKNLDRLANNSPEPASQSLPIRIEALYFEQFGNARPESVVTIEQALEALLAKENARKAAKKKS